MGKEVKTNAMRFLDKKGIAYEEDICEVKEFTDGVELAHMMGHDVDQSYKTLVTVGKSGNHYVFVIPVACEVNFKSAASAVGEKNVEMIHVKDLTKITGYIRGGCSPIGMKKQFKTVIDETALNHESIYISGGRVGSHIRIAPSDLINAIGAETADIIAH